MRRRLLWIFGAIVIAALAFGLRDVLRARAQKKREVAYQLALASYAKKLTLGMPRKDVDSYLRANHVSFSQRCCFEARGVFADVVKVGEDDAPWYCSETDVYVALEFAGTEPAHSLSAPANEMDVLNRIAIERIGSGCL
jgi:hypothetical protein